MQRLTKKITAGLVAVVAVSAIYSCSHSGKNGSALNDTGRAASYDTVALANYQIYLRSLDTLHPNSTIIAAKKYADLFKGANQDTRDSAFSVFKDFYNRLDQNLDNNRDATISYDSLIRDPNGDLPKLSPRLTAYAQTLKDNGFVVYTTEGSPYIGQDLDFEVKWFYAYLSEPLKAFLTQLNKENKEGFTEDQGLVIKAEQLADRTVWWENFAKKCPQTIVGRPAKENWKSYLGTMMAGMENSPVSEPDKSLNPYYKAAYTRIMNNYGATQTAGYIRPYFKLLENKENAKAKDLLRDYQAKKIIY